MVVSDLKVRDDDFPDSYDNLLLMKNAAKKIITQEVFEECLGSIISVHNSVMRIAYYKKPYIRPKPKQVESQIGGKGTVAAKEKGKGTVTVPSKVSGNAKGKGTGVKE